jgi:hypothetical protein
VCDTASHKLASLSDLVHAGNGEVLSTRVYRGVGPPGGGAGIEMVSVGCCTHIATLAAHEMTSCFVPDQQVGRDRRCAVSASNSKLLR